jgi:hypothetical protein
MSEILMDVVTKAMEKYVMFFFASSVTCITFFNLWMLQIEYDFFPMVVTSSTIHESPPIHDCGDIWTA